MNTIILVIGIIVLIPALILMVSGLMSLLLMGGEIVMSVMETMGLTIIFLIAMLVIGYMLKAIQLG